MTNEEAIDNIRCALDGGCRQICNAKYRGDCTDGEIIKSTEMAVKALENADRYKWHDIRKNPDDWPDEIAHDLSIEVWVVAIDKEGLTDQYKGFYQDGKWWTQWCHGCQKFPDDEKVIAWRYIEPFEVEDDK